MAALQFRSGVYRLIFWHNRRQHSISIGPIPLSEAQGWKGRAEHLLMRVEQRLLEVPAGVSICGDTHIRSGTADGRGNIAGKVCVAEGS